ncbi:MAG TPA: TIGR01777 family oxidoreductase [Acidimicrobiales bacterium]|nr:TIGR01777 family oxidoreductase [Acidimicrobiales bacterium]
MKVAITGSSGLIGSALVESLLGDGHQVARIARDAQGRIDTTGLAGSDAVVHLAGEPIASKLRWNDVHKRRVRQSRVDGTRRVAEALARLDAKPRVLLSASAVGYYGSRGDEVLDEQAGPGAGFLAELCVAWEAATAAAVEAGIRVARTRSGLVLDPRGGLLPKLLLPGKLGLGARLGNGRQWMSWITLDDEVRAMRHVLTDDSISGPVNLSAPGPVTNATMTHAIGGVLKRPAFLAVPAPALRLALGRETADETVLTSQRAEPAVLGTHGFEFVDPELEPALHKLLSR